jgi:TP901 family phage tail tape measure protein
MLAAGTTFVAGAAAIGLGFRAVIGPAMQAEDQIHRIATAMDDGAKTAQHLAEVEETVQKASATTGMATSALRDDYYSARSMALSHAQALDVVNAANILAIGTSKNHADALANEVATTRLLATVVHTQGGNAKDWADQLALLQSTKGFESIADLNAALAPVLPAMKALKIDSADIFGAEGVLSTSGYDAGRIGVAMNEIIAKISTGNDELSAFQVTNAKGGLNLYATINRISQATAAMNTMQRGEFLKSLGFNLRDAPVIESLLAKTAEYHENIGKFANAGGTAQHMADTREQGGSPEIEKLTNAWERLKEAIGTIILPNFTGMLPAITAFIDRITKFVQLHSEIVKMVAVFASTAGAVMAILGPILVAGAGVALLAAGIGASIGTVLAWGLAIGSGVALVAGLAVAAYEVIKHWSAVSTFFAGLWATIKAAFNKVIAAVLSIDWLGLGGNIVKAIASGIEAGVMYPVHAIGKVATAVMRWLPRSPAQEGPFRDLDRLRFGETIAGSITPGPMVAAMRKAAAMTRAEMAITTAQAKLIQALPPDAQAALENGSSLGAVMQSLPKDMREQMSVAYEKQIGAIMDLTESLAKTNDTLTSASDSGGIVETVMAPVRTFVAHVAAAASYAGHAVATGAVAVWHGATSLAGKGIDAVLRGIMGTESSFGRNLYDRTGGTGLGPYQMDRAFRLAHHVSNAAALDPRASTAIAKRIFEMELLPKFHGDMSLAISSWHLGVAGAMRHGPDLPYLAKVEKNMSGGSGVTINSPVTLNIHATGPHALDAEMVKRHVADALDTHANKIHALVTKARTIM